MIVVNSIAEVKGKIICEHPYVEILEVPTLRDGKYVALANYNGALALVQLKVAPLPDVTLPLPEVTL